MEDVNNLKFMGIALNLAKEALQAQEVPVGCIFVLTPSLEIVAEGRNEVNETKNPTRHAEFVCIDRLMEYCSSRELDYKKVFKDIIVYVSVEPCIMCSDALHSLGVQKVVYGCANDRFGGSTVFNVSKLHAEPYKVVTGVLGDKAMDLLKQFYQGENPLAPKPNKKNKSSKSDESNDITI